MLLMLAAAGSPSGKGKLMREAPRGSGGQSSTSCGGCFPDEELNYKTLKAKAIEHSLLATRSRETPRPRAGSKVGSK